VAKGSKPTGTAVARSRSLGLMAKDIMEGYVSVSPLVLKKFDVSSYQELFHHLRKLQASLRGHGVPLQNQVALRERNLRLQRMHQALSVMEFQAKLHRITLV